MRAAAPLLIGLEEEIAEEPDGIGDVRRAVRLPVEERQVSAAEKRASGATPGNCALSSTSTVIVQRNRRTGGVNLETEGGRDLAHVGHS